MPKRGANPTAGHSNAVLVMPCPATNTPLVRSPVFGTMAPIEAVELGPRNCPVIGFIACRLVPLHG